MQLRKELLKLHLKPTNHPLQANERSHYSEEILPKVATIWEQDAIKFTYLDPNIDTHVKLTRPAYVCNYEKGISASNRGVLLYSRAVPSVCSDNTSRWYLQYK